jgi:hypothetical protein
MLMVLGQRSNSNVSMSRFKKTVANQYNILHGKLTNRLLSSHSKCPFAYVQLDYKIIRFHTYLIRSYFPYDGQDGTHYTGTLYTKNNWKDK